MFRDVGRGWRTITGRRMGYYGKWKDWWHVESRLKGERRVGSRWIAEDELAELGERTGNVEGIPRRAAVSDLAGGRKPEGNGMRGRRSVGIAGQ